jgi:hypothetical protein
MLLTSYLIADKGAGPIEPMVITPNRFPFLSENGMEAFDNLRCHLSTDLAFNIFYIYYSQ